MSNNHLKTRFNSEMKKVAALFFHAEHVQQSAILSRIIANRKFTDIADDETKAELTSLLDRILSSSATDENTRDLQLDALRVFTNHMSLMPEEKANQYGWKAYEIGKNNSRYFYDDSMEFLRRAMETGEVTDEKLAIACVEYEDSLFYAELAAGGNSVKSAEQLRVWINQGLTRTKDPEEMAYALDIAANGVKNGHLTDNDEIAFWLNKVLDDSGHLNEDDGEDHYRTYYAGLNLAITATEQGRLTDPATIKRWACLDYEHRNAECGRSIELAHKAVGAGVFKGLDEIFDPAELKELAVNKLIQSILEFEEITEKYVHKGLS